MGLFVGRDEEDVVGVGVRVEGSHGAVLQGALTGVVGGRERRNTLHVQRRDLQFIRVGEVTFKCNLVPLH